MRKSDLAFELARKMRVEPAAAADQVDLAVNRIIRALRRGSPARLPGLGTITPGKEWTLLPEKEAPGGK